MSIEALKHIQFYKQPKPMCDENPWQHIATLSIFLGLEELNASPIEENH